MADWDELKDGAKAVIFTAFALALVAAVFGLTVGVTGGLVHGLIQRIRFDASDKMTQTLVLAGGAFLLAAVVPAGIGAAISASRRAEQERLEKRQKADAVLDRNGRVKPRSSKPPTP